MRKIILADAILLLLDLAYEQNIEMSKQEGSYAVVLKRDKKLCVIGNTRTTVTIKDTNNKTIDILLLLLSINLCP